MPRTTRAGQSDPLARAAAVTGYLWHEVLHRDALLGIYQDGVEEKIDGNSSQLAEALDKGRLIIITTLQKFPYVLSKVGELGNRRFALFWTRRIPARPAQQR